MTNLVLETFAKNVLKNTSFPETILFCEKVDFFSKITKLNFVDKMINSQRMYLNM